MIPEENTRASSKLEKLGKVHLTKQMVREREIFLGVKSKLNRARRTGSRDFEVIESLQGSINVIENGSGKSTAPGNASM